MTDLTPTAKSVAAVLAAVGEARVEMPESIADTLGVTDRSLTTALGRLEAAGIITWHRRRRGGERDPYHRVEIVDFDALATAAEGADVSAQHHPDGNPEAMRYAGPPPADHDGTTTVVVITREVA